jgi:arginase
MAASEFEDTVIKLIELTAVRDLGIADAAERAIAQLTKSEIFGYWIHLDADVLDDTIMPAVDYRMPDGLSWDELATILRKAVVSNRAVGLDITIFNPKLDSDGSIANAFVDTLARELVSKGIRTVSAQDASRTRRWVTIISRLAIPVGSISYPRTHAPDDRIAT